MEVQPATHAHSPHIESVARSSFQTSYSLSPTSIDTLVEHFFIEDSVANRVDDSDRRLLVVTDDDDVVGFAEVDTESTLRWLHVDPAVRGQEAGTALIEQVGTRLESEDVPLTARILEAAREGRTFLEEFGLSQTGTTQLEFDSESFREYVYTETGEETDANEPSIDVPETVDAGGQERRVDEEDTVPGTEAPFFGIGDSDGDGPRWGFLCTECGSVDVSADGLDRLICGECGNTHLADQWDEAYL